MSHSLADARSLALHRAVAGRVRMDASLVERARQRVAGWRADGSVHPHYCSEWERVLDRPVEEIAAILERNDENARALRQTSPFAGVLNARQRWMVLRTMRAS